jgi:hypothetical protein
VLYRILDSKNWFYRIPKSALSDSKIAFYLV